MYVSGTEPVGKHSHRRSTALRSAKRVYDLRHANMYRRQKEGPVPTAVPARDRHAPVTPTFDSDPPEIRSTKWLHLVAAIPWLVQLPPQIVAMVDLVELAVPVGRVADVRAGVEQQLGVYVMTYRHHGRPRTRGHRQLCELLMPAHLDAGALTTLSAAENLTQPADVVLCAYASPLRYRQSCG